MESRQPGHLEYETPGFASPPRDGFALNVQLGRAVIGRVRRRLEPDGQTAEPSPRGNLSDAPVGAVVPSWVLLRGPTVPRAAKRLQGFPALIFVNGWRRHTQGQRPQSGGGRPPRQSASYAALSSASAGTCDHAS